MAKRRRKRRKKVAAPKSKLPRQDGILHAIRCSNDVEWLREVAAVSRERYSKACELKQERETAAKWNYIRTYCKRGTWVVLTKPWELVNKFPTLLQVTRHLVTAQRLDFVAPNSNVRWQLSAAEAVKYGLVALSSLDDAAREPFESQLFEAGLEQIGKYFDGVS
jgi:hypothetical protein